MTTSSKTFCKAVAHCFALLVLSSFAYADGKDDVVAAAEKSFSAKSYSWVGKLTDQPEAHAKTETDGYTSVVLTIDGKQRTAVLKNNNDAAALTDAGWKSVDDILHDPNQVPLGTWMAGWFVHWPAHNVHLWIAHVNTPTADNAGKYTGDYDPEEIVRVLGGRHKGTTVTDAHGTLAVTITDGYITFCERHLTGTVANSDGTKTVDRQESFSLSDYNTTTPDVPDAAKQVLAK